jgi:hypothetical protein
MIAAGRRCTAGEREGGSRNYRRGETDGPVDASVVVHPFLLTLLTT